MAGHPWTDEENDLVVADYFAMLDLELSDRPCNKAARNRALQSRIDRSHGSIEYKHQNISAILLGLGQPWIAGYKPAANFQLELVAAVEKRLCKGWPEYLPSMNILREQSETSTPAALTLGPPPTMSNERPPDGFDKLQQLARRFDAAGRDARNRALGKAGEQRALEHEQATLTNAGRLDLAACIRWVSQQDGDGAGYDIASYFPDGRVRLIEVKTTNGWKHGPFHITRNELAVARERPDAWRLLRLWNFARGPQAFELRPPLERHVSLLATSFEASFLHKRPPRVPV